MQITLFISSAGSDTQCRAKEIPCNYRSFNRILDSYLLTSYEAVWVIIIKLDTLVIVLTPPDITNVDIGCHHIGAQVNCIHNLGIVFQYGIPKSMRKTLRICLFLEAFICTFSSFTGVLTTLLAFFADRNFFYSSNFSCKMCSILRASSFFLYKVFVVGSAQRR